MVGQIEGALTCPLNEDTQEESRTFTPAATTFLVVKNMQHMYDFCFLHTAFETVVHALTPSLSY